MINDTIFYIGAILLAFIVFEKVATLQNSQIKKYFVTLISVILIGWLDFYSLLLLTVYSTFIIIVIKRQLKLFENTLLFVILNILLLIFIKDYYLLFDIQTIYVPLGVSYYFFRLIAFVIEYNKHKNHYEEIPLLDYYLYVFFFPIFLAGPIQRFRDFYILETPIEGDARKKRYLYLIFVFIIKIILIDALLFSFAYGRYYPIIVHEINQGMLSYRLFLFGFIAFIHAYMDLMIYTEISKTVANLLGFSKQENFNKPLLATNISQFWQSWHMSLSNWTRDYVFFPTLIKTKQVWLSTYASMFMIGIWHSISINWLFWAFMHGSALNLYLWGRNTKVFKAIIQKPLGKKLLAITGNIVTITFVSSVFIIVAIHDRDVIIALAKTCYRSIIQ
jgi:alginate O-acetyltransferase complex protein AlgI